MKDKIGSLLHNSSQVLRRNIGPIMRHLFFAVLSGVLLAFVVQNIILWIVLIYNAIMLVRDLFGLVIDYLDSVFVIRGLSDTRKRLYDSRILRIKRHNVFRKKQRTFLMPYQTTCCAATPQVLVCSDPDV